MYGSHDNYTDCHAKWLSYSHPVFTKSVAEKSLMIPFANHIHCTISITYYKTHN